MNLLDEKFATHSLDYITFQRPFDQHHLLANFDYLLKETVFKRLLRLKSGNLLFLNWRYEFFVPVPDWWEFYWTHRILYSPTAIVIAYDSNLVINSSSE